MLSLVQKRLCHPLRKAKPFFYKDAFSSDEPADSRFSGNITVLDVLQSVLYSEIQSFKQDSQSVSANRIRVIK
jgi:hypothetical protein